jgi:hypothetical protein
MTYTTTQAQAKDRVIIKRQLRLLGMPVYNDATTISLALALRKLSPEFVFPVNVAIDLADYDRATNPKYIAKPVKFCAGKSVAIQNLADDLAFYLNDGWDEKSAINQVFSNSAYDTDYIKSLVLEAVGI